MQQFTPPKAVAVEVVPAQPTETDSAAIAHLSARDSKTLPGVAYLVKVRLEVMPAATSHGWALYVKDVRVPKYWEYEEGIYFKVFDPQFFRDHKGEPLRFSLNGTEFVETGLKLGGPSGIEGGAKPAARLPAQETALRKAARRRPRKRASPAKRRTRRPAKRRR